MEAIHAFLVAPAQGGCHSHQVLIQTLGLALGGNGAVEIFLHHSGSPGKQIAQIIGQVVIDAVDQGFVGEKAVGAEGNLPQKEISDGVHAVAVAEDHRVYHIALGLGHLAAVSEQEPAVAVDLLGQGKIQSHQDRGPNNGVEPYDLLADEMDIRRPVFPVIGVVAGAVAHGGDVVGQSVQPNVNHMLGVKIHRNPPGEAGSGYTQVIQAVFDKLDHLVFPALRLDKVRLILVKLQQPVGIVSQLKEIGFLLGPLYLTAAVGAFAVLQLGFRPKGLTRGAIPALIFALVDFAPVIKLFENFLHRFYMVIVGGTDKPVVADI